MIDSSQKKIGDGATATVHKARWVGQLFAVKKIYRLSKQSEIDAVRAEIALMSVLRHENIVSSLGCFTLDEETHIIVELLANGSAANWIREKSNPLPLQFIISMALDCAKGFDLSLSFFLFCCKR